MSDSANNILHLARHRYHVHGVIVSGGPDDGADVTISVDAASDDQAQQIAWLACPSMDVCEIEQAD